MHYHPTPRPWPAKADEAFILELGTTATEEAAKAAVTLIRHKYPDVDPHYQNEMGHYIICVARWAYEQATS